MSREELVKEFHKAMGQPSPDKPVFLSTERNKLRVNLIKEEVQEVEEALNEHNMAHIAKELADLLYVTYGTAIELGITDILDRVFREVHESNMSKLEDGKPVLREDGKILKGKNYKPVDLSWI